MLLTLRSTLQCGLRALLSPRAACEACTTKVLCALGIVAVLMAL